MRRLILCPPAAFSPPATLCGPRTAIIAMTRSPRTVDLNFATRGVTPDAENHELVAAFSFAPPEAGTVLLQSKGYAGCHKSRLAFDERLRNLTLINGGCSGDAACGGQLFTEKGCAVCHNDPSSGAPTLARGAGGYSDITMVTVVWRHGPAMLDGMMQRNLAWARFTAQQMADLIAHLNTLPAPPLTWPLLP